MGESEGREDELGDPEGGAVPEGADLAEGHTSDPAHSESLPPLPGRPKSSGDLSLDLAAALDEPEQLVRMLIVAAQEHVGYSENGPKWAVIVNHAAAAAKELEKRNEPASRRGAKASPS